MEAEQILAPQVAADGGVRGRVALRNNRTPSDRIDDCNWRRWGHGGCRIISRVRTDPLPKMIVTPMLHEACDLSGLARS